MEKEITPQPSTEEMTPASAAESQNQEENTETSGHLENQEGIANTENPDTIENPEGMEITEDQHVSENQEIPQPQEKLESPNPLDNPIDVDTEEKSPLTSMEEHRDETSEDSAPLELPSRPEHISEEDYQVVSTIVTAIESEISTGAISDETLALLLKSVTYDRAVATARHEGEVAARNQRIDEYMQERRRKKDLPDLGRSTVMSPPTLPYTVIGGLSAADRKSIWERGNEKRLRR